MKLLRILSEIVLIALLSVAGFALFRAEQRIQRARTFRRLERKARRHAFRE